MSYYQDLGVAPSASGEEIRESYRTLVRLFHPDQHTDPTLKLAAEAQLVRFNEIYAVLSDADRRRHYNAELAAAADRGAPIIIHAPRPMQAGVRVPWGTVTWGSAVLASAALILWLSNHEVGVNPAADGANAAAALSRPARVESTAQAALPVRAAASNDPAARAIIEELRQQLRLANGQRDDAWRLLNQARQDTLNKHPETPVTARVNAPKPVEPRGRHDAPPPQAASPRTLPEAAAMELPPVLPAAPLAIPAPARSHLAGQWLWTKPRASNRNKALYPPEYIETTIVERNGSLHGRYRARYLVADRAISPNVNFEFDGKATEPSAQLAFLGDGGAKGEVRIKLISDDSIEVKWSATDLGKSLGLSAGTAVLMRKPD
jgi:curved DNA-binding protein CbpA